jgi:hypothetical protein
LGLFFFGIGLLLLLSASGLFFKGLKWLWFGNLSVAQGLHYFEDLGPRWEVLSIFSLVFINGYEEFKLLIRHLAFFGRFSLIASASARTPAAIEAKASVRNVSSAVPARTTLREVWFVHFASSAPFLLFVAFGHMTDPVWEVAQKIKTSQGLFPHAGRRP